jgi:hypothetical protein
MSSYLEKLIQKTVTSSNMGTSTTYGINFPKNDPNFSRTEIELTIIFEDYALNIYNPLTILPSDKELLDFIGLKLIVARETKDEAELIFDNGYKIIIDLRDDAYFGPEAMSLVGPGNFLAVWN